MKTPGSKSYLALIAAAVLSVSCSDAAGPDPDPNPLPDPVFIGSSVAPGPANVLSAVITVNATGFDAASVRMRTPGEPDLLSPPYAFDEDIARPAALGMLADKTYEIDVLVTANGVTELGETLSFVTGALPTWLPTITPVGTPAEEGYIALSHPGGPVIVDNLGQVRWYFTEPDPTLNSFMSHPNGEYTLIGLNDPVREYRALNELGEEVRTLACVNRDMRFHEIRVLADGSYWALCQNPVPTDLSSRGGDPNGIVDWTVLQRVSAGGVLEFEFNSADHFSLDDIDQSAFVGATVVNITHGNAIGLDTGGDVIVSWRSLDEVTKISGSTGGVIWRLGGVANQFTVVDDTRAFQRPHGLRVVGPGLIQLLDNGTVAPSRFVRYSIDEQTMTATRTVEFITVEGSFTPIGGSTELVGTDGALVSFGAAGKVVETDAAGVETFDLTGLDGLYIFRASRIPSLYASERTGN